MPITITNISLGPVVLKDLGLEPLAPTQSVDFPIDESNLHRLNLSANLRVALGNQTVTVIVDNTEGYSFKRIAFPTAGSAYLASREIAPVVAELDGMTVKTPPNPDDGDMIFSPLHRLDFYWDATRNKWLSKSIFLMNWSKIGQISVGDYFDLYGVPSVGFQAPFSATLVHMVMVSDILSTGDAFDLSLERNGLEMYSETLSGTHFFKIDLDWDTLPCLPGEIGYQMKLKSCVGTTPQNIIVNVGYRVKL